MKTKSLALSVAALGCFAATSAHAGSVWSFAFGYSSGGVAGAIQVAAPVAVAPPPVVAPRVTCAPYARVAWATPAPVLVSVPPPQPVVTCVAPIVFRPVAVCAPVPVYHWHPHHRHGW